MVIKALVSLPKDSDDLRVNDSLRASLVSPP